MALFLCPALSVVAQAKGNDDGPVWVEEYEFVSATEEFYYRDAPDTVRESGRVYSKTGDIKYEKIEEVPIYGVAEEEIIREITKPSMAEQKDEVFPESITVEDEGQECVLQRQNVQWAERVEEGKVSTKTRMIDYGVHTEKPDAVTSLESTINGENMTMELKEIRQTTGWQWVPNHIADITLLVEDGIALDSDRPEWEGKEPLLLELLHLDPLHYILRSGKWTQSYNGGDMRSAEFTLDRYVANFVAIYQCEVKADDKTFYDGKALYSGKVNREVQTGVEYKVKAIVTYQAPPDPVTPSPTPSAAVKPPESATPSQAPAPPVVEEKKKPSAAVVATTTVSVGLASGGSIWYFFVYRRRKRNGSNGNAVK